MKNLIQSAKDQAAELTMAAYRKAVADGTLPEAEVKTAPVEIPKDTANGDYTTTFALAASKALRQPPRNIAQALLDHMDLQGTAPAAPEHRPGAAGTPGSDRELLCLRGDCGTGFPQFPAERELVCRRHGRGGARGDRVRHQ